MIMLKMVVCCQSLVELSVVKVGVSMLVVLVFC